jgi:tetratricopeptide (TPR) repeat protein
MREPLTPMAAYTIDVGDGHRWLDHPTQPHGWFAVAHVATRAAALPDAHRRGFLDALPDGLLPDADRRPTHVDHEAPAPAHPLAIIAERLRVAAEEMERDGCFELAYTTVSAAARLAARHDAAGTLSAANHLARIARQLGETRVAEELYESVVREARQRGFPSVAGYALTGLGNLAIMRGNRPAQLAHYREALALAPEGTALEAAAHWGLMNHALAMDSLADALLHGWRAYDLADTDETRAGILSNLASVAFKAGFVEPAVAGYCGALLRARPARLWLSIAAGAAESAGAAGRPDLLAEFEAEGRRRLSGAAPFETAQWLLGLARGWRSAGGADAAERFATESRALALRHEFHEVAYRADALLAPAPADPTDPGPAGAPVVNTAALPSATRIGLSRLRAMAV